MSFLDRQSKKERKGSYFSRVVGGSKRSSPYTKESPRKKAATTEGPTQRTEVSEGSQEAGTSESTAIVIGEGTGEEVALEKRKREENDGTFNKNKCIN